MPTYDFRCRQCGDVEVDVVCPSASLGGRVCRCCGGKQRMVPGFNASMAGGPDIWERTLNDKPKKESKWI